MNLKIKIPKWKLGLLAVPLVVMGLGASAYFIRPTNAGRASDAIATYVVQRGDLTVQVLETGNIKALESMEIRSQVAGETKIISIVPEGTVVSEEDIKNGKILVELDSSSLKEQASQQEIKLNQARLDFTQAQEDRIIQKNQNDSDLKKGEQDIKFALMDLEKYLGADLAGIVMRSNALSMQQMIMHKELEGEALQKKRKFEADIDLAREEVNRAQDRLNWTKKLHEKGYATGDELKADELALKTKHIDLEKAQEELNLFLKYDFAKKVEELISKYKESEREFARIKSRAKSREAQTRSGWESKKLNYELQKTYLAKVQQQIEKCSIRAARPGLVVYGGGDNAWLRMENPVEEGAKVRERQSLISLPDLSVMAVDVKVAETSIKMIRKGQKAVIRPDAFPSLQLTGYVNKVAAVPDSQVRWMSGDVKVYSAEVVIDGRQQNLNPGMSANVEIIIEKLSNVLLVPVQSVFEYRDTPVCYIPGGDRLEARPIVLGSAGESFIQVKEGLREGERILMRKPNPKERIEYVPYPSSKDEAQKDAHES